MLREQSADGHVNVRNLYGSAVNGQSEFRMNKNTGTIVFRGAGLLSPLDSVKGISRTVGNCKIARGARSDSRLESGSGGGEREIGRTW